jgi:hypothetical protein
MSNHNQPGHECPQLHASAVYEGETADATILIEEVFTPGGTVGADCIENGVALAVVDNENTGLMVVDPEYALEIAAGITEAAHRALWRRELAGGA